MPEDNEEESESIENTIIELNENMDNTSIVIEDNDNYPDKNENLGTIDNSEIIVEDDNNKTSTQD